MKQPSKLSGDIEIGAVEIKDGVADTRVSVYADNAAGSTPNGIAIEGQYQSSAQVYSSGDMFVLQGDINGNAKVTLATTIAGEDLTNDVHKVEQRFTALAMTGDTLVKSGAGFIHTITFLPNDAAPTAGSIILSDNTAESGTQILNWSGITTTWFVPFTITLDATFTNGLYVGFTTTADVNVTVTYR